MIRQGMKKDHSKHADGLYASATDALSQSVDNVKKDEIRVVCSVNV